MRKNRAAIKRLIPEANLLLPRRAGRAVSRDEEAPWELLDENFRILAGVECYRTSFTLCGQTAGGGQMALFDLEARVEAWTVLLFTDLDLPDFLLTDRHDQADVEEGVADEVRIADEAFAARFRLVAEDEQGVEELFRPAICRHLLRSPHSGFEVEVKNGYLLFACSPLDLDEYPAVYRHVARLVGLLEPARQSLAA